MSAQEKDVGVETGASPGDGASDTTSGVTSGAGAARSESSGSRLDCEPGLLALLVCPYTRTSLGYDAARQELISRPERLAFPIREGVPILVREEARSLDNGKAG